MKFSEKELDDIAYHLQVAAGRYWDDAASVCVSRVADQFRRQAKGAMALAERIHRREDDEQLLTIEEACQLNPITETQIAKAVREHDADLALKSLMDIAGIKSGDVAGMLEWDGWPRWSLNQRTIMVRKWIAFEHAHTEPTAGRKPRRIKCTDSLGNVAYLYPSGATWRCVLACGTPAAFSYAIGPFASEAEIRFKLEDAESDEERLATLRKAHERCPNYRAELV